MPPETSEPASIRAARLREALRAAKRGRRTIFRPNDSVPTAEPRHADRARRASAPPSARRSRWRRARPDIMLSYAHADRDVVLALRSRLIGDGYAVWWDGDIPPGESYRSFIAARIREAGATVVVWSVASVASEFVADEAELARILGRLLPVHVDGFDLGTIPLGLGQRQAVPLASYPMLLAALAARGVLPYGGRKGRCRNPHQAPGLGSGDPDGKSNSLPRTRQSG